MIIIYILFYFVLIFVFGHFILWLMFTVAVDFLFNVASVFTDPLPAEFGYLPFIAYFKRNTSKFETSISFLFL